MFSRRETEGYVLIDHRESPGLTEAERIEAKLSPLMSIGKGQLFEAPTFNCSHCSRLVIMNPLRDRARNVCFKCNKYICDDPCMVRYVLSGGECHCLDKRIATFLEKALKEPLVLST